MVGVAFPGGWKRSIGACADAVGLPSPASAPTMRSVLTALAKYIAADGMVPVPECERWDENEPSSFNRWIATRLPGLQAGLLGLF